MKARLRALLERALDRVAWPPLALLMVALGFRPIGGKGARRS